VAAWEKVGAACGWAELTDFGVTFYSGTPVRPGAMPAFKFHGWKAGVLPKLARPEKPFGLDFQLTPMTDAGLKELAAFKSLRSLVLIATEVTDSGMKELAAL